MTTFKTKVRLHGGKFHGRLVEITNSQALYYDNIVIPEELEETTCFGLTTLINKSSINHIYVSAGWNVRSTDGYQLYTFTHTTGSEN